MNIASLYKIYLANPKVETDTRKLTAGCIFFALKGDNFNGNAYALQAIEGGAAYAVVDDTTLPAHPKMIVVPNVLRALQELAGYHRHQLSVPVLAITGSNGKTTTKELVHAVLSAHFKTYTTEGNLNNHIGIPLTILRIRRDAEVAVIEMGANHLREIAGYCVYADPTHGIITNCGKAHLEGFGSEEGVRKGKGELYDHLRAHHGVALMMNDYDYLVEMSAGIREVFTYGTSDALVTGRAASTDNFLRVEFDGGVAFKVIRTSLVGDYNLPNVLAAVACGKLFGVPDEKIKSAIEAYVPSNSRSQLITVGSNRVVLDAYNANPSSMKLAIENFARLQSDKKVLLLGGMAEMGAGSVAEHQAIVNLLIRYGWFKVALVGGDFMKINHPFLSFANATEASSWFKDQHFENADILIKGSRSSKMETVI